MRPHPGVGQALAHVTISTTVLTHTLSFHEPFDASQWLLLAQESPYAGRGRSYGRAHVFSADGRVVASFVQDNMIRDFPAGQAPVAAVGPAQPAIEGLCEADAVARLRHLRAARERVAGAVDILR